MKDIVYTCNIEKCSKEAHYKEVKMQVIFNTDQTEGRSCKPYFEIQTLDLCEDHYQEILTRGKYLQASGAMGHNRYWTL